MREEQNRHRLITRRTLLLGGAQVLLTGVLGARMWYLQVSEAARYRTLADDNRISLRLLAPPRGRIFDRDGRVLALNRENYRLLVVPEQATNLQQVLTSLSELVDLPEEMQARVLRDAERRRRFAALPVRDNLTWDEVAKVEVNGPDLAGVMIDVGLAREYPMGSTMAHIVGYVGAPSEKDLDGDPLLGLPDFRIGKSGIERAADLRLRGRAGNIRVEVNAFGREIRELDRSEGVAGDDVQLTLDADLQTFATARLAFDSAAAVVMDIHSGDILALASVPTFDPTLFDRGISIAQWTELISNPRAPLINKAMGGQYPPGSTFKMVVALAALESGVISRDHTVFCPGHLDMGDNRFHCWRRGGHGEVGLVEAIAQSCDVFFYDIARRVGIDAIAAMGQRFGMGHRLQIGLPGEQSGLMPTKDWKQAARGRGWTQGETLIAGIGQGYVLSTPLQLAVMTARLANGGRAVVPRLYREIDDARAAGASLWNAAVPMADDGSVGDTPLPMPESGLQMADAIGVDRTNLELVLEGMRRVINHRRGTAHKARIEDPAYAFAGKTGTAQVRRITRAERDSGRYKSEDVPWLERDHALFVGFAPLHAPRYACSCIIEHGGSGSGVAAPVVADILRATIALGAERDRRRSAPPTPPPSDATRPASPGGRVASRTGGGTTGGDRI
ncbi:peptidoglycan glycosyltransferase [Tistrella bauzanensis]|uniref:Peptidoglycan glycosyltransferase n=1 Tax=Tistrella bauzanensis TaxID=657419 RepID=A0ABQ1IF57_9PROT|nr:penicillin-binding protein 2 [Tistrella bauzanensis]GGB37625.1 peptidoglycan glycosyltransferase [Tistrella bauzanensis]